MIVGFLRTVSLVVASLLFLNSCGGGPEIKPANRTVGAVPSPTQSERELSGVFDVEGSNDNGSEPYKGILNITNQGDVYSFRWTLDKGTRVGAGVQSLDAAAASFAGPSAGKGCGVVLYRIAADGGLEGKIARWGEEKFGIEKGVRKEGRTFVGTYDVSGTTPEGITYAGTLVITKDGSGYDFEWKTDKPFVGFGTWKGSVAAASFGGKQCSFALYSLTGSGDLDGTWGGQKEVTFGTEKAKRK